MTGRQRPGQSQRSFWIPTDEWLAAKAAAEQLDTTISDECRRALRNMVKRADRQRGMEKK